MLACEEKERLEEFGALRMVRIGESQGQLQCGTSTRSAREVKGRLLEQVPKYNIKVIRMNTNPGKGDHLSLGVWSPTPASVTLGYEKGSHSHQYVSHWDMKSEVSTATSVIFEE